jgi:hypothetical protein
LRSINANYVNIIHVSKTEDVTNINWQGEMLKNSSAEISIKENKPILKIKSNSRPKAWWVSVNALLAWFYVLRTANRFIIKFNKATTEIGD